MRISDWSSDVCSSDLRIDLGELAEGDDLVVALLLAIAREALQPQLVPAETPAKPAGDKDRRLHAPHRQCDIGARREPAGPAQRARLARQTEIPRSEEHTFELQSLMRISYAVFCLKKKKIHI